jgi:hypothetical protein
MLHVHSACGEPHLPRLTSSELHLHLLARSSFIVSIENFNHFLYACNVPFSLRVCILSYYGDYGASSSDYTRHIT